MNLHLHSVQRLSTNFWFPVETLKDAEFRASFPQVCASCVKEKHLKVYLVSWPSKLIRSQAYGGLEPRSRSVARLDELPKIDPVEILSYLPLQEPAPSPMICRFPTTSAKAARWRTKWWERLRSPGEGERCWLSVANIEVARLFLATNCGTEDEDYYRLIGQRDIHKANTWHTLPNSIRSRLSGWYKPIAEEVFIDYLRDEDPGMEAGDAGLVITDRRLVYHKEQTWRNFPFTENLTITTESAPEGTRVEITRSPTGVRWPSWDGISGEYAGTT